MPQSKGRGAGNAAALAPFSRVARRKDGFTPSDRLLPEEAAIAFSYGGTTHAVMMASPADLEDFALGFSLTEGIISSTAEIEAIDIEALDHGFDVQIRLVEGAEDRFTARRRRLAGPVGCGLCGIESIDEAMRAIPKVDVTDFRLRDDEIGEAVKRLSEQQELHQATGAVHAAGLYLPGQGVVLSREDVGRHNALDKLAGAIAGARLPAGRGAIVITSRVSVEMVQKAAAIGAPALIAVSAPTALAVRSAEACGMVLIALARGADYDIFTGFDKIEVGNEQT